MYSYKILLKFAYPTPEVPTDFNTVKEDIFNAMDYFNTKYRGKKSLSIVELSGFIVIQLETKELVKNPTREFNVFSQTLKSTYNWSRFSQVDFRLFDATLLEEPDVINREDGKITLQKIFSLESADEVKSVIGELEKLLNAANLKLESFE